MLQFMNPVTYRLGTTALHDMIWACDSMHAFVLFRNLNISFYIYGEFMLTFIAVIYLLQFTVINNFQKKNYISLLCCFIRTASVV
jgi:hypothetical protein